MNIKKIDAIKNIVSIATYTYIVFATTICFGAAGPMTPYKAAQLIQATARGQFERITNKQQEHLRELENIQAKQQGHLRELENIQAWFAENGLTNQKELKQKYLVAVEDARVIAPEEEKGERQIELVSITSDDKLIWNKQKNRILVASWVPFHLKDLYKVKLYAETIPSKKPFYFQKDLLGKATDAEVKGTVWVASVAEINEFVKSYKVDLKNKVNLKNNPDQVPLYMRYIQKLGLPFNYDFKQGLIDEQGWFRKTYDRFLALYWVKPEDLERPCLNKGIAVGACIIDVNNKEYWLRDRERLSKISASKIDTEHFDWFVKQRIEKYTAENSGPYPWSSIGYTYDWAFPKEQSDYDNMETYKQKYGFTEFAIKWGANLVGAGIEYLENIPEFIKNINKETDESKIPDPLQKIVEEEEEFSPRTEAMVKKARVNQSTTADKSVEWDKDPSPAPYPLRSQKGQGSQNSFKWSKDASPAPEITITRPKEDVFLASPKGAISSADEEGFPKADARNYRGMEMRPADEEEGFPEADARSYKGMEMLPAD